jgi:thiol-disulfide isomerase/thioredoxin
MDKLKRYFTLILTVMLLTLLVGCEKAPAPDKKETYRITLLTQDGEPLKNVKIFVYEDPTLSELVSVGTTDAEGCISFVEGPRDAFVAVLKDVPAGYDVEELYTVGLGDNLITLASRPLTPEELAAIRYGLGDQLTDLVVTDCDGNRHSLSELLKQKKAVVLNFWFLNCGPCKMEFPYVQQAYDAFGKDVAIMALNPVDGTDETVRNYRWENGLTFPMATCDPVLQETFQISAYPTTLIIDRTGTICLSHVGMFTDSVALCNALKYFTQETYDQKLFETIEEIPLV